MEPLTLDNCAREPIHVPGAIQPHGALLGFDRDGRLTHASANAAHWLGTLPAFGARVGTGPLAGVLPALLAEVAADIDAGEPMPRWQPLAVNGHAFDLVAHASGDTTVCEFEQRLVPADEAAEYAQKAYRSMDGLKRQRSVERLLEAAVGQVRTITGFDRVMGYRFRHDDSGDVVAEARREDLEPLVGRRYPASDIPAQARRLYVLNTLRLIADVAYAPVPLRAADAAAPPLDLSHSVLRSVSPVHVEYLRNMGVAASMSVSIVVNGRLWGMLACHHMSPLQVPYSTRLAADVIAQLLASTVQSLLAREREAAVAQAAALRTEVIERMAAGETAEAVLGDALPALAANLGCDAIAVVQGGRLRVHGDVPPDWLRALLAALQAQPEALVHWHAASQLPAAADGTAPRHCGVLGLRFDADDGGWLVGLRLEQVETIRWGGRPEKDYAHGPLGPRLTPRGSFDEWRETVRGTAVPWNEVELDVARELLGAVTRAHAERVLSMERARARLWAVLGHDLRNPLQSISMAASVIDRGAGGPQRMSTVIRNSTSRMDRLIRDVLDTSRIQNGLGLGLSFTEVDLVPLVAQIAEEVQVAHPDTEVVLRLPPQLPAPVDGGRIAQVMANLLSNARHHGLGNPIVVEGEAEDDAVLLRVLNPGDPIPPERVATLFDAFKQPSLHNARNPSGMGLGLYIAHEIAQGHGGTLGYRYRAGSSQVVFELRLPRGRGAGAPAVHR